MSKYTCEKCGKEFNNKSQHTRHLNNKKPCNVESKIKSVKNANIKDDDTTLIQLKKEKARIPKPILKWVGGKTQIVDKLISEFPTEIHNYREIFLGGGSVLLALLSYVKNNMIKIHGNIYAYDLNEPLIYVYKNIQSNHDELYNEIQTLITVLNSCGNGEINRTQQTLMKPK
jgi:hypothetical protein